MHVGMTAESAAKFAHSHSMMKPAKSFSALTSADMSAVATSPCSPSLLLAESSGMFSKCI